MAVFARQFLYRRKIRGRHVESSFSTGLGSGEQWVRQRFPKELKAVRGRQRAFLIVMIDADSGSTQNRRDQLYNECRDQDVAVPSDQDKVLIAVPRRNIETWFAYLKGEVNVDETATYRKLSREIECKPLADELYQMCHVEQKLRKPMPPSLLEVCELYPRLRR